MIKKISVLGAGTMGHGIALSFALYDYDVSLFDTSEAALQKAVNSVRQELELMAEEKFIPAAKIQSTLDHIKTFTTLAETVKDCDYVIEATPENMELKQKLFQELDQLCPPSAIFASNTSSLSLAPMASLISEERKKRIMVNHWYNPAHLMPLVELSFFGNMPEDIFKEVETLYRSIKKQTAKVLKDIPGLIANRIQQGVAREVFWLIEQGIAEPAEVDKALKFGPAFRYATTGQLEVADFGGLDIWRIVGDNLLKVMDASKGANPMLKEKVEQGKLGLKSGEGFFKYSPEETPEVTKRFMKKLIHQLKASEYYIEK